MPLEIDAKYIEHKIEGVDLPARSEQNPQSPHTAYPLQLTKVQQLRNCTACHTNMWMSEDMGRKVNQQNGKKSIGTYSLYNTPVCGIRNKSMGPPIKDCTKIIYICICPCIADLQIARMRTWDYTQSCIATKTAADLAMEITMAETQIHVPPCLADWSSCLMRFCCLLKWRQPIVVHNDLHNHK